MFSKNKKLLAIVVITLVSLFIAIPNQVPFKIDKSFFGRQVRLDREFVKPKIDFSLGSIHIQRNLDLKLGLDLAGGSHLSFEADTSRLAGDDRVQALNAARDTIDRRVNIFGVSEAQVYTSRVGSSDRIIVELPGVKDTQSAISLIGKTAQLDFREVLETEATKSGGLITTGTTKSTGFTGSDFLRAHPSFDSTSGRPIISFEIKPESSQKFADITTRLVGKQLAIFLDEFPISAPVVQTPITGGQGQITGQFTTEQTQQLSNLLNSGALPVPIRIIEQRTVEASLGEQAVEHSITAGIIGLFVVVLFMSLNYGRLGFWACLGLLTYGIMALALYKFIPIVLTLPGIAGFILSFGMAVDTNILVFERMKEELRSGRMWHDSMEAGFSRGWTSIRDANAATLIIAFIIFNPLNLSFLHTSGPVRGFAITLALGVFLSLFVSVFIMRTLLRTFVRRG